MKISALRSYFNNDTYSEFQGWSSAVRLAGGFVEVDCTPSYFALNSTTTYDLTESSAFIEILATPVNGNGSTQAIFSLQQDSGTSVSISKNGPLLATNYRVGGVETTTTRPYDPIAHKWWRIRMAGGTVFYEVSSSCKAWIVLGTYIPVATYTAVTAFFISGYWGTESNVGLFRIDNFNRQPQLAPVETGWTLKGVQAVENHPSGDVIFEDSFVGTGVNTDVWELKSWPSGFVNNELQAYTPESATVVDNTLVITARRDSFNNWTSARLELKQPYHRMYGRFEASIKVPRAQGTWPAFWLLGTNVYTDGWPMVGEIDIMEAINVENKVTAGISIAKTDLSPWRGRIGEYILDPSQWHTYSIDVRENKITLYIDRVFVGTITPAETGDNTTWPFNSNTFFMVLNLAIGGDMPGNPDATTPSTLQMLVKNVRIYN